MRFRSRTCRLWGLTNPPLLYIVVLLCTSLLLLREIGALRFVLSPAERWVVDRKTDCPPPSTGPSSDPTRAPFLSPVELLCRPVTTDISAVPRLLHQTWKSTRLPAKFERWSESCREKHEDWQWMLWTDEDNLELVERYFPWLLDTYRSLPGDIYRVDLVRNMYMYMFGG